MTEKQLPAEYLTTKDGDTVVLRMQRSGYVLFAINAPTASEPMAYGFSPTDFVSLAKAMLRLDEAMREVDND